MAKLAHKAFSFQVKATGEGDGTFEGLASVYGVKDLQGDIVDKGAFTKTLGERGPQVKLLWQHDQHAPIGLATLTDTPTGLKMSGKLSLGTTKGAEAYELLKDGVIDAMSIGYDAIKKAFKDGARHLQEVKLWEVSLVTFPANEDAMVSAVKAFDVATFDVKAFGLPAWLECQVAAVVQAAKEASLSDRLNNVYSAVRAAFPYSDVYPMSGLVYDDHMICSNGSSRFAWIPITAWDADGVPTLGTPIPVEFEDPTDEAAEGDDGDDGMKAGRALSASTMKSIDEIHDHAMGIVTHAKSLKAKGAPKKPGTAAKSAAAATAEVDPELLQSLRESLALMGGTAS